MDITAIYTEKRDQVIDIIDTTRTKKTARKINCTWNLYTSYIWVIVRNCNLHNVHNSTLLEQIWWKKVLEVVGLWSIFDWQSMWRFKLFEVNKLININEQDEYDKSVRIFSIYMFDKHL